MANDAANQNNISAAIAGLSAALAATYANPLPSYTVDGVTRDVEGYRQKLLADMGALIKLLQPIGGPFTLTSVAR